MNFLWGGMLLVGIVYGTVTGNLQAVTEAALHSAKEAVDLCLAMAGVMALWVGLMKIAENTGLIAQITERIKPVLRFLFPKIPDGSKAQHYISVNMIANFLGLGWAATPAGLQAMESLREIEEERRKAKSTYAMPEGVAGNEMCNFLILNISSLQLIPVNIIAYRSQYGSVSPTAIVGPAIAATTVSTLVGVLYCKWKDRVAVHR